MNLDFIEIFLDVAFVGLLVAVLIYAVKLNRNIGILQQSKAELQTLLTQFVTSTNQAEEALVRIRNRSRDATLSIDEAVLEAKALKADLVDLIERAEHIAHSVDGSPAQGRGRKASKKSASYSSGYGTGPSSAKKSKSRKPSAAKEDVSDLDAEIDKDLEERLARLIDSVEAGGHDIASDEPILRQQQEELSVSNTPSEDAKESKAKSKEELIKALRGMR